MKIDFSTAIAAFLSVSLLLVFLQWVFYNLNKHADYGPETSEAQRCPFCTYIFFDYRNEEVKTCPRCHSLIAREKETT